jgi:hypothetical protein
MSNGAGRTCGAVMMRLVGSVANKQVALPQKSVLRCGKALDLPVLNKCIGAFDVLQILGGVGCDFDGAHDSGCWRGRLIFPVVGWW